MGEPAIVLRPIDRHLTAARNGPAAFPESEILYCMMRVNRRDAGCYTLRFAE
ncbi:hypothetical protein LGM43_33485 [Burkholderia seminalis]|uniref:hypothetical protein n=1 Tax=Burkholderia seminalis TaxID=488731 RepID=UPI001903170E|nr:hypothetical protein [Burkholderia seminalis]MBJ9968690.1 hypothetical protein [Burkholderia seminalis]MCA7955178.1 hypothetical protein [Burkholderia seminalis]